MCMCVWELVLIPASVCWLRQCLDKGQYLLKLLFWVERALHAQLVCIMWIISSASRGCAVWMAYFERWWMIDPTDKVFVCLGLIGSGDTFVGHVAFETCLGTFTGNGAWRNAIPWRAWVCSHACVDSPSHFFVCVSSSLSACLLFVCMYVCMYTYSHCTDYIPESGNVSTLLMSNLNFPCCLEPNGGCLSPDTPHMFVVGV